MIVILALDDNNGMMFNHRRLSQDSIMIKRLIEFTLSSKLWVNNYSSNLFKDYRSNANLVVDDDFLYKSGHGEYCFVEDQYLLPYLDSIEKIIIYKWNRKYPSDMVTDLPLDSFSLVSSTDFSGKSHEKITEEVYEK